MNVADMLSSSLSKLPNLIIALLVLLIGWAIAKAIEKGVYKGLQKTKMDDKLFADKKTSPLFIRKSHQQSRLLYRINHCVHFIL